MPNEKFGYNSKLPEEIRDIFMWLCQDLAFLQNKWDFYLELYGSKENVELLSRTARAFFKTIEESLRNDITLGICRLSDPPKSFGKDNLSFQTLLQRCNHVQIANEHLDNFLKACKPVRQLRNKRVGHKDLKTAIEPSENFSGINRKDIDKILLIASKLLNAVYQNFVDAELYFHPAQAGGADSLIFWLRKAQKQKEHISYSS